MSCSNTYNKAPTQGIGKELIFTRNSAIQEDKNPLIEDSRTEKNL
jgi:hypothetical protein